MSKVGKGHLCNKKIQDAGYSLAERRGSGYRRRDTSQHSHHESEKNRSSGSQNSILNTHTSHSANSYKSDPCFNNGYKSSYRGSSKSCEHLLGSHSPFTTLSCDELDNKDIEEEEHFLNEEMKTEWIPKPTRSISLALFQSPEVSTKVFSSLKVTKVIYNWVLFNSPFLNLSIKMDIGQTPLVNVQHRCILNFIL